MFALLESPDLRGEIGHVSPPMHSECNVLSRSFKALPKRFERAKTLARA